MQLLPERLRDDCFLHVRYYPVAALGPVGGVVDSRHKSAGECQSIGFAFLEYHQLDQRGSPKDAPGFVVDDIKNSSIVADPSVRWVLIC